VSESGADDSLQQRYEGIRRWWCTGDGDARNHLGLTVLLHQGMRVWMRQAAHAESREATARDEVAQPRRATRGENAGLLSEPLHSEVARLLAVMAIGTIETREQTA
jgi:hypothetical protein